MEGGTELLNAQRHVHVLQVEERHVGRNGSDVSHHIEAGDVRRPRAEAWVVFLRVGLLGGVPLGTWVPDGFGRETTGASDRRLQGGFFSLHRVQKGRHVYPHVVIHLEHKSETQARCFVQALCVKQATE